MQRRDMFSVFLKAFGVWEIVQGLQFIPMLLGPYGQWNNDTEFMMMVISTALSGSGIRLLTGVALFFGADWLARWAYPDSLVDDVD